MGVEGGCNIVIRGSSRRTDEIGVGGVPIFGRKTSHLQSPTVSVHILIVPEDRCSFEV